MKGHAAFPERDDLARMRDVEGRIVKKYVTEPPANDDAEGDIDDEVVDAGRRRARHAAPERVLADEMAHIGPAKDEPGNIGERIPADRQRADVHQDRIDLGIGNEEKHFGSARLPNM